MSVPNIPVASLPKRLSSKDLLVTALGETDTMDYRVFAQENESNGTISMWHAVVYIEEIDEAIFETRNYK